MVDDIGCMAGEVWKILDTKGEMIAQGRDIPMHLGVMCFTVKEFLQRVAANALAPGGVWFLNLPEIGGNHLPDVKAIRPIFAGGELFAFAVSLAHWADIGGAVPGSYFASATDIWQEGLRISPIRLFTSEGPDREKLEFVLSNVRGAPERKGDIHAQMAATLAAERASLPWARSLRRAVADKEFAPAMPEAEAHGLSSQWRVFVEGQRDISNKLRRP